VGEFYFDETAADRAVQFIERFLVHTKGKWAGKPFKLEPWQRDEIIRPLFGWKRTADGTRKYREAYIELPRKNGKSTLSSGIALLLTFADGEPGAEVYSAAGDRKQAAIVFNQAALMVRKSPALRKRAVVYKNSIVIEATASVYEVLSADAHTKHGLNVHAAVIDELHVQPNRELVDVLTTATGSRTQPLVVYITTAGYDRESICWEKHEYARQVLTGVIDDPTFFAFIAAADEADDWTDPATWEKANPGYGVTISKEYLEKECKKAQQVPAYQNTFRRLHLNQWTQQDTRWLDLSAWDACGFPLPDLSGRECYAGLDLSSSIDIAAFLMVFPPEEDGLYYLLPRFWIPEEGLVERGRRDRVPYDGWVRDGFIKATEGNVQDYGAIQADIETLGETYNIREIAFDRWGAFQISQKLEGAGFTMVPFGQGFASMSAPMKDFLKIILEKKLAHGGNPVLRWMADNVVAKQDPAGNIKPDKSKSRNKIDGIVAAIMGLDRVIRHENDNKQSVYASRGLRSL
jgi:phage terminase large subunit-like protein